jgi:predicted DNA-binding transcriptional regulator YafY
MLNNLNYAAIDPMAMLLPNDVYLNWIEIHHPHLPSVSELKQIMETLTPDEKKALVVKAKSLAKYGQRLAEYSKAIENAAATKTKMALHAN